MSKIRAQAVLFTQPVDAPERYSLFTVITEAPYFIYPNEFRTHSRLPTNSSSGRYQSFKRHSDMGWWTPDVFYAETGEALEGNLADTLRQRWDYREQQMRQWLEEDNNLVKLQGYSKGIAKEQINRQLPTTKMCRGIATGTMDAWEKFFALRVDFPADRAMQELARAIKEEMWNCPRSYSDYHVPFLEGLVRSHEHYLELAKTFPAQYARVSGGKPGPGQRPDEEMVAQLNKDVHESPFSHMCHWKQGALVSAINSKDEDRYRHEDSVGESDYMAWETLRAKQERDRKYA